MQKHSLKQYIKCSKIIICAGVIAALSGCGGGDGGIGGGDPAVGCVQQSNSSASGVDLTNTCEDTIIVVSSGGGRLVVGPGETHRLNNVNFFDTFGACFSPSEPEDVSISGFRCS